MPLDAHHSWNARSMLCRSARFSSGQSSTSAKKGLVAGMPSDRKAVPLRSSRVQPSTPRIAKRTSWRTGLRPLASWPSRLRNSENPTSSAKRTTTDRRSWLTSLKPGIASRSSGWRPSTSSFKSRRGSKAPVSSREDSSLCSSSSRSLRPCAAGSGTEGPGPRLLVLRKLTGSRRGSGRCRRGSDIGEKGPGEGYSLARRALRRSSRSWASSSRSLVRKSLPLRAMALMARIRILSMEAWVKPVNRFRKPGSVIGRS